MKYIYLILFVSFSNIFFGQSLSNSDSGDYFTEDNQKKDSLHSSMILSVNYEFDTLYVKARHYAVCCEKFINYIDKKENSNQINFVVKSLEKGCICEVEKIVLHKIFLKNFKQEVNLRINGKKPNYGIVSYSNPNAEAGKKKKRKKKNKKNKEM